MSKSILTPPTPAAVGPDAVRDPYSGSWDVYVDGVFQSSRSNQQDALIEARRIHFENVEGGARAAAAPEQQPEVETVPVNVDTLVEAYERRPVTKIRARAWEWLSEQTAVTFQGDMLVVPSATWFDVTYLATPQSCTCPARGHCHHKEAAMIVFAALAEDAEVEVAAERDAYADVLELFA